MPRKKQTVTSYSGDFKGFITVNLTVEDEKLIDARELDTGRTFDELASLVEKGYKLSVKYDAEQGSCCATLMDNRADSLSKGFALSGWGADMLDATNSLLYKHWAKCDGVWPTELAGRPVSKYR